MHPRHVLAFLLLAGPAAGQALDSTQVRYRDALVAVRDALLPIGANVQSMRRDLGTAADVTVRAKTVRLQGACRAARDTLAARRADFASAGGTRHQADAARALVRAMRALETGIGEHCLAGLRFGEAGFVADSVRAWLPYRVRRLRDVEQAYHEAAAAFARAVAVRIPPVTSAGR